MACLSNVYARLGDRGYLAIREAYRKAREAATMALRIDDKLAEAHSAMGWIEVNHDWDWKKADESYRRAIELEPGNATVVRDAGGPSFVLGRWDEAIARAKMATELDPLNVTAFNYLARSLFYAGRLEEAIAVYKKVLELNPKYPQAHCTLSQIYLMQANLPKALEEIRIEPEPFWRLFGLALAYPAAGKTAEANQALSEMIQEYQTVGAYQIAVICAQRGETDASFRWLDRAYNQRDPGITYFKGDPFLGKLRKDPRHAAFLKKMRLPPD